MTVRIFVPICLLCLLPAATVEAAEPYDWSGAPAEWAAGIDHGAFCGPGEWFFGMDGERATATGTERVFATEIFFEDMYGRAAHRSQDVVYVDEMTALRIVRDDNGRVTMQVLAGTTVAASRVYEPTTVSRVLRRVTGTTRCERNSALKIELWDDMDDTGIRDVLESSLALGQDGSLVARLDRHACWLCINKNRTQGYVRFPAGTTPSR